MTRNIIIVFLAVITGACWAQEAAPAKPEGQSMSWGSQMRLMRNCATSMNEELFPAEMLMQNQKMLDLSDEQKKAIIDEMKSFSTQYTDLIWKQSSEQEAMSSILKQEKIDEEKALAQLNKLMGIENEIKRLIMGNLIKIRNMLTAEQKGKMRSIRQSIAKSFEEGRERRGGFGPMSPSRHSGEK